MDRNVKVGDRVKVTDTYIDSTLINRVGVVTRIVTSSSFPIRVVFFKDDDSERYFFEYELEVISGS